MAIYTFTLILARREELTSEELDRLYDARCDDATFGMAAGLVVADFDRQGSSAARALTTAAEAVERIAGPVHHAEPGDFVTTGDIADRLGRSRESVRLLASGAQGPGGFPVPVSGAASRTRLWYWPTVLRWFTDELRVAVDARFVELSEAIAAFNSARAEPGPRGRMSA